MLHRMHRNKPTKCNGHVTAILWQIRHIKPADLVLLIFTLTGDRRSDSR